jgi:probable F420-dependent oxidoreductase
MIRPFRFGLQAARINDPAGWIELARRAESTGYSSFLIPDHLGRLSTFPALMAAAAATQHIKLGSYVLNQDFRPPAVLAQEAASVHLLTGGRLELGIGAGWAKHEYAQAGLPFDEAGVRVARLDEYLQVVKGLLTASTPFSFAGEYFHIDGYQPLPRADGMAPPRIIVGGGSRHILSSAGRLADVISVSTRATPDGRVDAPNVRLGAVDQKVGWIRAAAADRFADIELNMTLRHVILASDRRAAARALLDEWARPGGMMAGSERLTEDDVLGSPHLAIGTVREIADQLKEARARWGFSYLQVGSADWNASAPLVEHLTGQ